MTAQKLMRLGRLKVLMERVSLVFYMARVQLATIKDTFLFKIILIGLKIRVIVLMVFLFKFNKE
ncbi:hypothetical protein A7456_10740 [Moraxella nonliquefaciens]|uniref:Uncharacterized protein n=1 Tax=Moraxella nonliquefaciens TaxID=478 RepID=A0A1B8QK62_MORNO|nr:hypothetical protein A7456_10740 [Moraxella nonliquefaciens]